MKHAMTVSVAFQFSDNVRTPERQLLPAASPKDSSIQAIRKASKNKREDRKPFIPRCQFWKCKKNDPNHWLNDCNESNFAGKENIRADLAAAKSQDGPADSTTI